jgi:hypothetical protein
MNNQTCQCYQGHIGVTCQGMKLFISIQMRISLFCFKDPVTTPASSNQINIPIIIASVLGSILCTLIVGLIIFFIWKRRVKKKSFTFSTTTSTTATIPPSEPVVAPALYDLSLSRQDSVSTVSYHLYDELP